ncbi:uncharacterized protein LOC119746465 [Patiria miniata]|uniref:Uncharacterized protein n=1 Tax=Patiria miniata TaxID=46514 RepID=A0A914BU17_PATMI|nr:uncharacterized protein LOC119746465 [Patiria miniata]
MERLHLFCISLLCLLCQIALGDQYALNPRGRNVCHLPKRPYHQDALRPYEWQLKSDDLMEYRCCDGWAQIGDSCPQAVCNTPCNHGYCAAPNYCSCDDHWAGPTCNEACPVLFEAGRCVYECDCPSRRCNYPDGYCACPLGFSGHKCNVPCSPGYYGPDCLLQCHCDGNVTCTSDTGSCTSPQNISTIPDAPGLKVHAFRMATLTGCGIAAVVALVSATAYAVRKRRTRRVFNVRKRTMSMTPIANRPLVDNEDISLKSTLSFGARGTKYQGYSVRFPGRCSTSYVGMRDLITNGETNLDSTGRPLSCLSTSTTISMVESLSECRDTIYEVREAHVLGALRNQVHNPRYTNSSVFSVNKTKPLDERLNSVRDGVGVGCDSDSDDELEYNYPYADLALRLPGPAETTQDACSRALRSCSSNTEYVVVLNKGLNAACFTQEPIELGLTREGPVGMSFTTSTPASSALKALPSPGEGSSTETQMARYQVPRSPPIQRFAGSPCNQTFVRGYVTSVRNPSSLNRGSEHRRTRRMKSERFKCPPPPQYSPPEKERDSALYVNDRISMGGVRQSVKSNKVAPPIPKPRTKIAGQSPAKTPDSEMDGEMGGEKGLDMPKTERFI